MASLLYKNSQHSTGSMLITTTVQELKKTDLKALIRDQKLICRKLKKLLQSRQAYSEVNNHLQVALNKEIVDQIYTPIKNALQGDTFQDEDVEYYSSFFQKFRPVFKDEILLKAKTLKQRLAELRHQRNTNSILEQFRSQNKLPMSCQLAETENYVYEGWQVRPKKGETIIRVNLQMFETPGSDLNIAKLICSLLNCRNAAVYLGLNINYQIQGIKLSNTSFHQIQQKIEKIRNQMIFPKPQQYQIFDIFCLKIEKNFGQNMLFAEDGSNQKQSVLIKIYANTESVGKAYFVMEANEKKFITYKFYQDRKIEVLQQKYYSNVLKKFYEKKKFYQPIKKSKPVNHVLQNNVQAVMTVQNMAKQTVDLSTYGKLPQKTLAQHSILIQSNGQEQSNKLFKFLEKEQDQYRMSEIFKGLDHTGSSRKIYYLNHRVNTQILIKKAEQIDSQKRHIIVLKIKPQLTLLRQNLFKKAFIKLKDRYQASFGKQLVIKRKQSEKPDYFFCFENDLQTLFSFCLLQYSNIRTNFANQGKMDGAVIMTREQLQELCQ